MMYGAVSYCRWNECRKVSGPLYCKDHEHAFSADPRNMAGDLWADEWGADDTVPPWRLRLVESIAAAQREEGFE